MLTCYLHCSNVYKGLTLQWYSTRDGLQMDSQDSRYTQCVLCSCSTLPCLSSSTLPCSSSSTLHCCARRALHCCRRNNCCAKTCPVATGAWNHTHADIEICIIQIWAQKHKYRDLHFWWHAKTHCGCIKSDNTREAERTALTVQGRTMIWFCTTHVWQIHIITCTNKCGNILGSILGSMPIETMCKCKSCC